MDGVRWQRVQELFHAAAAVAVESRADFLAALAQNDPEIVQDVLRLFGPGTDLGTFLEPPTERLAAIDTAPEDLSGQRVGNCTLTRLLGEGGMGAVYEAIQEPLGRPVAVKILRDGLLSPSARERFGHESRILASLRHPGIAQIFEAGTAPLPGGGTLPYFVMERVPGATPLLQYVESHHLPLRARVELLRDVALAVGHGHERGVIHRDLKPGNVLIDADGKSKVIDFGIARLREQDDDREFPTVEGMLVGTLPYMSPEQLRGKLSEVDTRSDVYSLGIMMYEAFLGERPHHFEGQDLPEILDRVLKTPPLRPRAAEPKFDPDLEAVLLTSVALDRSVRYASASALAEDLERFLAGKPVVARAITFGTSLSWFAKRHRRLLYAGGAVLIVALVGAAVASTYAVEARRERAAADARAEQALRLVASAQDLAQWTITDLDVLLSDLQGSTRARRLLADRMRVYLSNLGLELPSAPGFRRSLARAYLALAEIEGSPGRPNSGRPTEALERAREAERLLLEIHAESPRNADAAQDVAAVRLAIAELVALVVPTEVDAALAQALDAAEVAARLGASGARFLNLKSAISHLRAERLRMSGDAAGALAAARQSLHEAKAANLAFGDAALDSLHVTESCLVADLEIELGELNAAAISLAPLESLLVDEIPGDMGVRMLVREASTRRAFADLRIAEGRPEEALKMLAPAVDRRRRLCLADPSDPALAHDLVVILQRLGAIQMSLRDPVACRRTLEENLHVSVRCAGAMHPDDGDLILAIAHSRLAMVLATTGDLESARERGRELEAHLTRWRLRSRNHPDLPRCEAEAAELAGVIAVHAAARLGPQSDGLAEFTEAERHFLRARDILQNLQGRLAVPPPWLATALAGAERYLQTLAPTLKELRGETPDRH